MIRYLIRAFLAKATIEVRVPLYCTAMKIAEKLQRQGYTAIISQENV